MKKAKRKKSKPRIGRPKSTGSGIAAMVRLHNPLLKDIDRWIGDTEISRPEALRQLAMWALEHSKPKNPPPEEPLTLVRRARESERRA